MGRTSLHYNRQSKVKVSVREGAWRDVRASSATMPRPLVPDPRRRRQRGRAFRGRQDHDRRRGPRNRCLPTDDLPLLPRPRHPHHLADRNPCASVFEDAQAYVADRESFADQVVDGLLYLVDRGRRDPAIRLIVSPEHVDRGTALEGSSELAARLTFEMWRRCSRRRASVVRSATESPMRRSASGSLWWS